MASTKVQRIMTQPIVCSPVQTLSFVFFFFPSLHLFRSNDALVSMFSRGAESHFQVSSKCKLRWISHVPQSFSLSILFLNMFFDFFFLFI